MSAPVMRLNGLIEAMLDAVWLADVRTQAIGVALYPSDGATLDELLRRADAAAFEARLGLAGASEATG